MQAAGRWGLVFGWGLVVLLAGRVEAAESVTLSADRPAIKPAAAPLYARLPDADRLADGPRLVPPALADWIGGPDRAFELTVTMPARAAGDAAAPAADDAATRADEVLLTAWNWRNEAVWERRWPVPCDEALTVQVGGRGTWLLTLDALAGDQTVARQARAVAAAPDNTAARATWATDHFQLGICAFPGRLHWRNDFGPALLEGLSEADSRALEARLMARVGFTIVRTDVPVDWPAEDQPLDFDRMDAAVRPWLDLGFRLLLQTSRPGDWAILDKYAGVTDPKWRYPKRVEPTVQLNAAVAARYRDHLELIELLNEPDNADFWLGTVDEYLELLRALVPALRQAAPGVPLASGSYTLQRPVYTGQMAAGQRDLVDLVTWHSHGAPDNLLNAFRAMEAVHAAAGYDQPAFWQTETGSASWRLDQDLVQAQYCLQKVLLCWALGQRGALLYDSRGIGGPRLGQSDWGLVDHFYSPRFLYGGVAGLAEALAGARFEQALAGSGNLRAYTFRRGETRLVAAFTLNRQPATLTLTTDAPAAVAIDAMGNRQPLPGGDLALPVDGYPTYLELPAGSTVGLAE